MGLCLRGVACALSLLLIHAATASAEYIVYPSTDIDWRSESPNRNAPQLGQCVGNCGAGCSDAWNPGCGSRNQYWDLQVLSEPQATGYRKGEYLCYSGSCYYYEYMRMQAIGRWTYHGYFGWGCLMHDSTCPEFLWGIGCLWFGGCGSGWNQDWSYDTVVFGWLPVYFWEVGPDV